jgi:hypothetical protein
MLTLNLVTSQCAVEEKRVSTMLEIVTYTRQHGRRQILRLNQ